MEGVMDGVLGRLRELSEASDEAAAALIDYIVEVMRKPPKERGATTYQLADAIGRSRQQLHQIFRDATSDDAED